MRRVTAKFSFEVMPRVYRVVNIDELATEWEPDLFLLALVSTEVGRNQVQQINAAGLPIGSVECSLLAHGDVVTCQPERSRAVVLFRESDTHHSLQMTNRCNSYCLMCSQPPTPQNDDWLVEEALEVVRHIKHAPAAIGLSGGEPVLLGAGLRRVIEAISQLHPTTAIDVLSNGRLLGNAAQSSEILAGLAAKVSWLVPLYGHADFLHDFVVQSHGAFDETIAGLLNLQMHGQAIQLRIVLVKPVLESLIELCGFVGRNLPFVREVALIACEPIGFALANRDHCEVDLADWSETLVESTRLLRRHHVPFLFMNAPLCALPRALWPAAHRSISDWKNVYSSECDQCVVKAKCSGLFAWHETGWKPTKIQPVLEVAS
jgi:His-Xaa-Ser system radical SAM maturase HxsC